jgi:hypothetical protein
MSVEWLVGGLKSLRPRADLKALKEFVSEELPPNSILRRVVLSEEDEIDAQTFLRKVPVWTSIFRKEKKRVMKAGRVDEDVDRRGLSGVRR